MISSHTHRTQVWALPASAHCCCPEYTLEWTEEAWKGPQGPHSPGNIASHGGCGESRMAQNTHGWGRSTRQMTGAPSARSRPPCGVRSFCSPWSRGKVSFDLSGELLPRSSKTWQLLRPCVPRLQSMGEPCFVLGTRQRLAPGGERLSGGAKHCPAAPASSC